MHAPQPRLNEPFRAFFRENLDYVVKSLRRLGVREEDCEDIAHELFLAVHRRFDELDSTRPVRPYLFGYARRFASTYRQSARIRREATTDTPDAADLRPNAEQELLARDDQRLVHAALDRLDDERREVFVMYELDARMMEDIALELNVPLSTVVSRLRGARADFAAHVRRLRATGSVGFMTPQGASS